MNIPKFKAKLAENNIKIKELCEIWDCKRNKASRIANGKQAITLDEAQVFAKYAKLTDDEKLEIFLN